MNHESDSPNTGESQTPYPSGGGGNAGGMGVGGNTGGMGVGGNTGGWGNAGGMGGWGNAAGMGGMPGFFGGNMGAGMGGMPVGAGMGGMPGFFGGFPWGFGGFPSMGGMGGGMVGGGGNAGAGRPVTPQSPLGDNVYRPSLDGLADVADDPTAPIIDIAGDDTFSLEELGLSPIREHTPQPAGRGTGRRRRGRDTPGRRGRGRPRGKGKEKDVAGESSQAEGEEIEERRTVYSPEECTALAKAWVSVCDDPIGSNNQNTDRLWTRILLAYEDFKPRGAKFHKQEELRKQWDRIKTAVSRFAGIYQNNTLTMTSGMTMDDVKELSYRQFPEPNKFGQFKYWDAYLELIESPKFRAGMAAGWPKRQRLGVSGEYSSSAGSHDLNDDVDEVPPPVPRRRRPMGQKSAMRMSRGASSGSGSEVQSAAPNSELTDVVRIQATKHLFDVIMQWQQATDPKFKKYLEGCITVMQRNLGLPADNEPAAGDAAGDAGEDADE